MALRTKRSPTSRCTITSIRSTWATPSRTSATSGVATLYGRLATSTAEPGADHTIPVERHRVGFDDLHVRDALDDGAQRGGEPCVDLDRGHRRAGLGKREGQRPEPGTDLNDVVAGPYRGQVGDAPNGVGVGNEVLPEVAAWCEVVLAEQFADPLPRMRHRRTAY